MPAGRRGSPATRPSSSRTMRSARSSTAGRWDTTSSAAGDVPAVRAGGQPVPQRALGLDVERGGEVVDDEQLGTADERTGRERALKLPARQAHAARPDHGRQPVGHRRRRRRRAARAPTNAPHRRRRRASRATGSRAAARSTAEEPARRTRRAVGRGRHRGRRRARRSSGSSRRRGRAARAARARAWSCRIRRVR